jgi:hypothetical protein
MKMSLLLPMLLSGAFFVPALAQKTSPSPSGALLDVGIRLQKSINLYAENGITAQYTNDKLAHQRLYFGLSYVTSRLGTALNSNAIKQDNVLLSASYYFWMKRQIRPVIKANIGYFAADYGSELFADLPKTSPLASPEFGLSYCPNFPLKINASIGFNLLTGDGVTGPGTLYPVFVQTSVTWNVLNKR